MLYSHCSHPLHVFCQVTSANAFAQTLRRYTSLNHLAQAARAVLQNTAQINQMLSDLNRVDFANVQVGSVSEHCALTAFMTNQMYFSVFRWLVSGVFIIDQMCAFLIFFFNFFCGKYTKCPTHSKKFLLLTCSFIQHEVIQCLAQRHLSRACVSSYMSLNRGPLFEGQCK